MKDFLKTLIIFFKLKWNETKKFWLILLTIVGTMFAWDNFIYKMNEDDIIWKARIYSSNLLILELKVFDKNTKFIKTNKKQILEYKKGKENRLYYNFKMICVFVGIFIILLFALALFPAIILFVVIVLAFIYVLFALFFEWIGGNWREAKREVKKIKNKK